MARQAREFTFCNCAGCGRSVLGDSWRAWYARQPEAERARVGGVVAGRISGRPYCGPCLAERPGGEGKAARKDDGAGPWAENAVRALEDG